MSSKYKFWDSNKMYFISFATVHWIDVFIRNEYRDVLLESWKYCQKEKGLEIYGWCIMPSHVHMIVSSHGKKLEEVVKDMKVLLPLSYVPPLRHIPRRVEKNGWYG